MATTVVVESVAQGHRESAGQRVVVSALRVNLESVAQGHRGSELPDHRESVVQGHRESELQGPHVPRGPRVHSDLHHRRRIHHQRHLHQSLVPLRASRKRRAKPCYWHHHVQRIVGNIAAV